MFEADVIGSGRVKRPRQELGDDDPRRSCAGTSCRRVQASRTASGAPRGRLKRMRLLGAWYIDSIGRDSAFEDAAFDFESE